MWVTVQEAAQHFGLTVRQIRIRIKNGRLDAKQESPYKPYLVNLESYKGEDVSKRLMLERIQRLEEAVFNGG